MAKLNKFVNWKRLIWYVFISIFVFSISSKLNDYNNYQGLLLSIFIIAISCVILLTGYSGQLSLGQGAFMATGAYTASIAYTNFDLNAVLAFVLAVFISGIFGLLIGLAVARFSGPYLSGTTLALAFSLPAVLSTFTLFGAGEGIELVLENPFDGILKGEISQDRAYFLIGSSAALITIYLISNILSSKFGRVWKAIRDNETSSSLNGINTSQFKILAFTISSGFSGLAGALLAVSISGATPSAFPLSLSFLVLTGAVVTGLYSLKGVLMGGLVVVAIPILADYIVTRLGWSDRLTATMPTFIVSGLLIFAVLFSPNGPAHLVKKKRNIRKLQRKPEGIK